MEPANDSSTSETYNMSQTNLTKYKEIISTLPQTNYSWMQSQQFHNYQGFWCLPSFLEGSMYAQEHFTAQSSDIILCSHPKSGTTWLKSLCFSILTRTHFNDSSKNNPLLTEFPHEIVQHIDFSPFLEPRKGPHALPLWATHIPYNSLPKSILESSCKIIYICRDPKDVLISMWHFTSKAEDSTGDSLKDAFDQFCEGVSTYGPCWDHILGYRKASLQFPEKILFIKYEDLQNDTFLYLKRLAEFMGCPFSMEEERQEVVQKIVNFCSFKNLSNLEVNKSKEYISGIPLKIGKDAYFRKGKIGDWKNYLTPEMAAHIDKITYEKFSGSGLAFKAP